MLTLRCARGFFSQALLVLLASCSNGSGSLEETAAPTGSAQEGFSVGGALTGLIGTGLVLQNNGASDLTVAADGSFAFANPLAPGASYNVTVLSQPTAPQQTCTVVNGSGTVASANITNVVVTCATGQFSIGGNVAGLSSDGLVLQNNGGDDLQVASNGGFTFASRLTSGATYSVTVRAHPSGQNCVVRNASGTISSASITNVEVSCAANQFTIGGRVGGLLGSALVLRLNASNELSIASDGPFAFGAAVANGAAYEVTVRTQPRDPTQICTVTNAVGTVAGSNVTSVTVNCASRSFSVGGTVSGLSGGGLVLRLNDGQDLTVASNGSFTFGTPLTSGTRYAVTVARQPSNPAQTCTVGGGSGTIGSANVTGVRVACASGTFSIGGSVSGLLGSGLVLQNNQDDNLTVNSNGSFRFSAELASGATYNVTVRTQPSDPAQACTVTNGRGTVGAADVISIVVSCSTSDFTIGGTVTDLEGSGLVLRNNGMDALAINSNGRFIFDAALPMGSSYNVTIAEQPSNPSQACTVSNGTGVVGTSNVTNVSVRCGPAEGFRVGGHVSKMRGSGLILQNNGGDDLAIASNGEFQFETTLPGGATYNVTVARQPSNPPQTCEIKEGSGTIGSSDIQNVKVRCGHENDD